MAISHVFTSPVADKTGTVTFWDGATTASAAATDIVKPGNWNSAHNQYYTLTGNTLGSSTASGTNVVFGASNNVSLRGTSDSVYVVGEPHMSSYANLPGLNASTIITFAPGSVSHAAAFMVPHALSASFLRLPVLFTTNSTTYGTTAASLSASAQIRSTWNAVVYSLGTGASSKSLISVASGSAGFTQMNSISVAANGTQYSVTQAFSAQAEGGGTTHTTQYSISNTNYSFTTNQIFTAFSSVRFLDIPFANSLSPGPYWLIFGVSTSSLTNSSGISLATQCNNRYSAHYGISQANLSFGVMGSTNRTSGGLFNGGSFSTAGGGTTSGFPISAISSSASHNIPYFQLLRSA